MAGLNRWLTITSFLFIGATGYGIYEAFGKDVTKNTSVPRVPLFNTLFSTEFAEPTPVVEEKEPQIEYEVPVVLPEKETEEEEEEKEEIEIPEFSVSLEVEEEIKERDEEEERIPEQLAQIEILKRISEKPQEITQDQPIVVVDRPVVKTENIDLKVVKAHSPKPSLAKDDVTTVVISSEEDVLASSAQEIEEPFPSLTDSSSSSFVPPPDDDSASATQISNALPGEDETFVKSLWSNSIAVRWRDKLILAGSEDTVWDNKVEKANKVLEHQDIWVHGWSWWQKGTKVTRDDLIYICRDAIARTPWGTWWAFRYKVYWDLTWYFCSKPNIAKPKNWWYYTEKKQDAINDETK